MQAADVHLRASLLDCLVDDQPEEAFESVSRRTQQTQALRQSVQRDVQHLLSTRRGPGGGAEAGAMVQHYGVPDLIHLNPRSEADRQVIGAMLQRAIERWEPRLRQVQVAVYAADAAVPELLGALQTAGPGSARALQPAAGGQMRSHLRSLLPAESVVIRVRALLRAAGRQEPVSFPFLVRR